MGARRASAIDTILNRWVTGPHIVRPGRWRKTVAQDVLVTGGSATRSISRGRVVARVDKWPVDLHRCQRGMR
jgi:hypothetical protein